MNSDRTANNKVVNKIPNHYLIKKQTPKLKRRIAARQVALDRINQSGTRSLNSNLLLIALSGTAAVAYKDSGTNPSGSPTASSMSYNAGITGVGTNGPATVTVNQVFDTDRSGVSHDEHKSDGTAAGTSVTVAYDLGNGSAFSVDMGDTNNVGSAGAGGATTDLTDERGVSWSSSLGGLGSSALLTDANFVVGLTGENYGLAVTSGNWTLGVNTGGDDGSTVTASWESTTMSAQVENTGGNLSWDVAVGDGVALGGATVSLDSAKNITAAVSMGDNTITGKLIPAVAYAAAVPAVVDTTTGEVSTAGTFAVNPMAAYSTVAISRALTSGAALAATYSSYDNALTLKASVKF